jgi:ubiquinone/menaquinone biosynthesis C-methylase UbiE
MDRPFDFDLVYRGRSPLGATAPWDIGAPQPVLAALVDSGRIRGPVLDVGCGTGEHAALLAAHGHTVTGVDISPVAIGSGRAKAARRGVSPVLEVGDAVELAGYERSFDGVVDCGFLDSCTAELRPRYTRALHRVCRPGAAVYRLELSDRAATLLAEAFAAAGVPHRVLARMPRLTADDIRNAFRDGWTVVSVEESVMTAHLPGRPGTVELPAWFARLERT